MWHPIPDPIVHDDAVFLELFYSCALLEGSGAEPRVLWNTPVLCNGGYPSAVLVDGYLYGSHWPPQYFVSGDDWETLRRLDMPFRCVEWKTGKLIWENSKMKSAGTIAAGGKLIILDVNGTLRVAEASPTSYQELCSVDVLAGAQKPRIFASPPVLCNAKIYCRNYAGDLVCIDVSR
jgi:outer membrane protein assembly factor BamB